MPAGPKYEFLGQATNPYHDDVVDLAFIHDPAEATCIRTAIAAGRDPDAGSVSATA